MAKIEFSERARARYEQCRKYTEAKGDGSLRNAIDRLSLWGRDERGEEKGVTIYIGCDFDEMSFTFRESLPDGRTGTVGGIIYHGERDGFGSGAAPTFSVTLDPAEGYRIHT